MPVCFCGRLRAALNSPANGGDLQRTGLTPGSNVTDAHSDLNALHALRCMGTPTVNVACAFLHSRGSARCHVKPMPLANGFWMSAIGVVV